MTELFQQAIAEVSKLSDEEQNAIARALTCQFAAKLLAELADEQAWQERFAATTNNQWDNLVTRVRQEIETDKVVPLDEVFPVEQ